MGHGEEGAVLLPPLQVQHRPHLAPGEGGAGVLPAPALELGPVFPVLRYVIIISYAIFVKIKDDHRDLACITLKV